MFRARLQKFRVSENRSCFNNESNPNPTTSEEDDIDDSGNLPLPVDADISDAALLERCMAEESKKNARNSDQLLGLYSVPMNGKFVYC